MRVVYFSHLKRSSPRKEQGLTSPYVFLYGKRTIDRVDRAFRGVLAKAGIEDFRFHDLRHTFASHLVMRGASVKEVQGLLGQKTMTMTLRYAHLGQGEKKRAVCYVTKCHKFPSCSVGGKLTCSFHFMPP